MQPVSIDSGLGRVVAFTVVATGEGLTYQWLGPGGVPLTDVPGRITGATTATLQIVSVQIEDAGSYRVRVSNAGGSVDSDVVSLAISEGSIITVSICIHDILVKYMLLGINIFRNVWSKNGPRKHHKVEKREYGLHSPQ